MVGGVDVAGIAILAERVACPGQFPLKLDIYVRDDAMWKRVEGSRERVRIVRKLSRLLAASSVLARDELNGEMDYLIRPTGEILEVEIGEGESPGEHVLLTSRKVQGTAA